jgi:predicted RNA binding protein YcfA (HicA-like mRNA interferase family)
VPDFPEAPQEKVARALERLGFTVDRNKGKGSHYKVYGPSGSFTILPNKLRSKGTRHSILKFLEKEGTSIEAFKKEL